MINKRNLLIKLMATELFNGTVTKEQIDSWSKLHAFEMMENVIDTIGNKQSTLIGVENSRSIYQFVTVIDGVLIGVKYEQINGVKDFFIKTVTLQNVTSDLLNQLQTELNYYNTNRNNFIANGDEAGEIRSTIDYQSRLLIANCVVNELNKPK